VKITRCLEETKEREVRVAETERRRKEKRREKIEEKIKRNQKRRE